MRTRIISAFPGTGKSHYHKLHLDTTLDSDSSKFGWQGVDETGKKVRVPNWVDIYIEHIKENIGKYEIIFVSSHKEVRQALIDNCIFFYLIYPDPWSMGDKKEYLKRYVERGSDNSFITLLDSKWKEWTQSCYQETIGCKNIKMVFPYLDKEIDHLIRSENGDSL